MNRSNILVVDDEAININIVAEILSEDYNIKIALNGEEAISILKSNSIDLILLDIIMPNINGYEVASMIQADKKISNIPFIFLTSKNDTKSIIKGFEYGAVDYIAKPFIKEELRVRVRNHVNISQLQNHLALRAEDEIAKRKKNEHILIQQSKMADMGEMIGNIAHQWRQPLNELSLILSKIELFYENDKLTKSELDSILDISYTIIEKMSTTIDDFRNFFKVDKKRQKYKIVDSIDSINTILDGTLKAHNIELNLHLKDRDLEVLALKNELEQVFLNIINNSKDALIENSIKNPKIDIEIFQDDFRTVIEIFDNAKGVPIDIIEKIFEPYFTTKESDKGTGIGLYMSKMIIENNMNGSLRVENRDSGACFIIELKKEVQNE